MRQGNGTMADHDDRLLRVTLGTKVVRKTLCIIITASTIHSLGKRSMSSSCIAHTDAINLGLEMSNSIDILMQPKSLA